MLISAFEWAFVSLRSQIGEAFMKKSLGCLIVAILISIPSTMSMEPPCNSDDTTHGVLKGLEANPAMSYIDQKCLALTSEIKDLFTKMRTKEGGPNCDPMGALSALFCDPIETNGLIEKYKSLFTSPEAIKVNLTHRTGLNEQYKNIFWNGVTFSPECLLLMGYLQNMYDLPQAHGLGFNIEHFLQVNSNQIHLQENLKMECLFPEPPQSLEDYITENNIPRTPENMELLLSNYPDEQTQANYNLYLDYHFSREFLKITGNPALFIYHPEVSDSFYVTLYSVFNGMLQGMPKILQATKQSRLSDEKYSLMTGLETLKENLSFAIDYLSNPTMPLDLFLVKNTHVSLDFMNSLEKARCLSVDFNSFYEDHIKTGLIDVLLPQTINHHISQLKRNLKDHINSPIHQGIADIYFASQEKLLTAFHKISKG